MQLKDLARRLPEDIWAIFEPILPAADGAYGNEPSRDRAGSQGFRLQAPGRGRKRPGVGKVRNAVERCHNFFAQFGRVRRRRDRHTRNYLGWGQMAACVSFSRSGCVR